MSFDFCALPPALPLRPLRLCGFRVTCLSAPQRRKGRRGSAEKKLNELS